MPDSPDNSFIPIKQTEYMPTSGEHHHIPAPYAEFSIPEAEQEPVSQREALLSNPEIAGYLGGDGAHTTPRNRLFRSGMGLLITALLLTGLFIFLPGNMFHAHITPVPYDTPKPQPYAGVAALPILFREQVRDVNDSIQSGKWQSAFAGLRALVDETESGKGTLPSELRAWSLEEMLVILASRELPPDSVPAGYRERIFDEVDSLYAESRETPSFRSGSARIRLLDERPVPAAGRERQEDNDIFSALEKVREDHPDLMDKNRDILLIEAERHIEAFPGEYAQGDRYLDYHWRRAAHAINRLYDLFGKRDPAARELDRKRWQAVYKYFDFTILTLDTSRLGRLKNIRLDGTDYTREQVRREIERL